MNLLVVDWDYFCPAYESPSACKEWWLYDWSHSETALAGLYAVGIWPSRLSAFIRAGMPRPTTSGAERDFWSRVQLAPKATLFVSDSNAAAYHPKVRSGMRDWKRESHLYLYDAHHDAGYHPKAMARVLKRGTVECEDWMFGYLGSHTLHVRYPAWKTWALAEEPEPEIPVDRQIDDGSVPPVVFDRVFVCRSSAWTPPWLDVHFFKFLADAPVKKRVTLSLPLREWGDAQEEDARNIAGQTNKHIEALQRSQRGED